MRTAEAFKRDEADFERETRFNVEVAMKYRDAAIKPEDFVRAGVLSELEVSRDNQEMSRFKHSPDYSNDQTVESVALEYAVLKLFDDGEFGNPIKYAQKTAVFDDTVRGMDFYIDVGEEGEVVPIGIDVTTSTDIGVLGQKIRRNTDVVTRGELPRLKYFYNGIEADSDDPKKKFLTGVVTPRVVLGIDREATAKLQWDLLNGDKNLENKYVLRFLEQIMSQLEQMANLAKKGSRVSEVLARTLERVKEIYIEKGLQRDVLKQAFENDPLVNPKLLRRR